MTKSQSNRGNKDNDPIPENWRFVPAPLFLQHCFVENKPYGQASRAISTGKLHALLHFHTQPIKQVIYLCPSALAGGRSYLGACFPLICLQRLSLPNVATRRCPWRDNRHTRGSFVQVLSYYGPPPSNLLRLPWIGTELSRDVLNPAHVPL